MALKLLILEDYQIRFGGFSIVMIGALVLAKVVLILEYVPLCALLRDKPQFATMKKSGIIALGIGGTTEYELWVNCNLGLGSLPGGLCR